MPEARPGRRLDQPRSNRRFTLDIDPEAFGRFSENLARFLGTGKFLFWQTLFVILWILANILAFIHHWDPYPFVFLNLAFSTQAAYAAPLILLAQNRQDDRDRVSLDEDRTRASQTKADTEFLARELAALRIAIGEIATRDYLRGELERLRIDLDESGPDGQRAARDDSSAKKRKTSKARPQQRKETVPAQPAAKSADAPPAVGDAAVTDGSGDDVGTGNSLSD